MDLHKIKFMNICGACNGLWEAEYVVCHDKRYGDHGRNDRKPQRSCDLQDYFLQLFAYSPLTAPVLQKNLVGL